MQWKLWVNTAMTSNKPKFGDKSIGRSPIERLIVWLDAHKILKPLVYLLILLLLIGIDSTVRNEQTNGVIFLILVFLILLGGDNSTKNFFGASALAVFIILHISLFGINSIALISSFVVFLFYNKRLKENILGPISIYLIFDIISYLLELDSYLSNYLKIISNFIFTYEFVVVVSIIPVTLLFLRLEKYIFKKFENEFIKNYGVFLLLGLFIYLFFILGVVFGERIFYFIGGGFLILYFVGAIQRKDNLMESLFLILPILLLLIGIRVL